MNALSTQVLPQAPCKTWTRDQLIAGIQAQRERAAEIASGYTVTLETTIAKGLEILRALGYRETNRDVAPAVAVAGWAAILKPFYVSGGEGVIEKAFADYAKTATSQYRDLPLPAEIAEIIRGYGINPEAEAARRRFEASVAKDLEEDRKAAAEELTEERRESMRKNPWFREFPGSGQADAVDAVTEGVFA
jgi:hypothetical protein